MSIKSIDLKFKSGNDVPVTRAEITIEEWEAVKAEICGRDRIVQVSGFGVNNTHITQSDYFLVAVTESGKVVISRGDCQWSDVSPKEQDYD